MTTYQTDHTLLPATCSPHCNPGMHDLIDCSTPLPKWTPSKPPRKPDWPGVGTLRPRSDEDGEVDDELSDWRAAEEYGGGRPHQHGGTDAPECTTCERST